MKGAVKHINNFEETVAEIAIMNNYDYVICGHIHTPIIRNIFSNDNRSVQYLNSGDWVENLSSLEYNNGGWSIYNHGGEERQFTEENDEMADQFDELVDYDSRKLLQEVFAEIYEKEAALLSR